MKKTYFAFVHKNDDGLWCEFPDFESCYTQGDDLLDLIKNAADMLETYVESMVDNGEEVPEPSGMDKLQDMAKACEDEVAFLVPITAYLPLPTARINITASGNKIEEITEFARKTGTTRSELMVNATIEYIRARQA